MQQQPLRNDWQSHVKEPQSFSPVLFDSWHDVWITRRDATTPSLRLMPDSFVLVAKQERNLFLDVPHLHDASPTFHGIVHNLNDGWSC